ncbi:LuxR family transcriptional regulator [Catenuloplanes indicus]|uniref:DNA-binding NarL/FixJ family response regulator n=1 Tax=Catenuloplanes indicus TaxID=137267 RepID=A0AAE3W8B7_9ACTN|nr:LuxR family transcriptional regulator [Catenuloplanes indicus]MDQ0370529.1 DNA-binding NarL/FixJ family response regulator [Catenuloplanes indicus]
MVASLISAVAVLFVIGEGAEVFPIALHLRNTVPMDDALLVQISRVREPDLRDALAVLVSASIDRTGADPAAVRELAARLRTGCADTAGFGAGPDGGSGFRGGAFRGGGAVAGSGIPAGSGAAASSAGQAGRGFLAALDDVDALLIEARRSWPVAPDDTLVCLLRAAELSAGRTRAEALVRAGEAICFLGDHFRYAEVVRRAAGLDDRTAGSAEPVAQIRGFGALFEGRYPDAVEALRRVVTVAEGLGNGRVDVTELIRGSSAALVCGDDDAALRLAARAEVIARAGGDNTVLSRALELRAAAELWRGAHDAAASTALAGARAAADAGQPNEADNHLAMLALLAALRGDRATCRWRLAQSGAVRHDPAPGDVVHRGPAQADAVGYATAEADVVGSAPSPVDALCLRPAEADAGRLPSAEVAAVGSAPASAGAVADRLVQGGPVRDGPVRDGRVQDRPVDPVTVRAGAGHGRPWALGRWALGVLDLLAGRPQEAVARLAGIADPRTGRGHVLVAVMAAPDLVEAAVLAGDPGAARAALTAFDRWAASTGEPLRRALAARCHALLARRGSAEAEAYFREALRLHLAGESEFERARTQLLFGRDLRRRRRPGQAREQLGAALDAFVRCGARPWAEQARAELRVCGGAVRPAGATVPLTAQQLQIARLVASGATNREVAARLFLSTRTVDHHMRNIFLRLGISSRVALAKIIT